jgi:hypothetical protein
MLQAKCSEWLRTEARVVGQFFANLQLPECGTETYPCLKSWSFYMNPTEITLAGAGDAEGTITYGQFGLSDTDTTRYAINGGAPYIYI